MGKERIQQQTPHVIFKEVSLNEKANNMEGIILVRVKPLSVDSNIHGVSLKETRNVNL